MHSSCCSQECTQCALGTFEGQSEDGNPEGANHFQDVTPDDRDSQNNENVEEPLPTEAYLKEIREQVEDEEDPHNACVYILTKVTIFNCIVTACLLTA